ncbi:bifunctional folylpolyglutamate synthase/dihydrofolate synthase [Fructobacillus fructosus]|uniref:Folylpolyglutamate synthase/Dihydropteroate synthase (FolC) n=1 Tax=Fructobacillus fructosus TaxID=1631 RepID=A0ABN9YQJ1_9LACO|nr:folylpolyglutamate synthase/dihydrofolate synthase family protein [Fructobacillus fructosus]MBC9119000.1 bifunctional folylpolyglutamate synthase/dihydrofolate synthase [Fructobacillus fructosus]MBD9365772.1 bifunctional folylpolyglutamate synthase/dihydrofolate synthase [Leuconostoc mesenteroides]MCK8638577.1 bifunctional folylpolyglutamate synthase/dihydrofolate synthase [Fructobacillus fructosus]CAK1238606.1 Folylpolyglutamate synthase/Dihydropteroate synthase (FolC) [Fructobacillus fruct
MTIDEVLAAIHSRPKVGKKDSQERMTALLSALGHPEKDIGPAIHVTGTNGKGSVANMLSAIGIADGLRVGLFTSPFIVRFNDRFQINGQDISNDALVAVYERVQVALRQVESESDDQLRPTEFEVVTAMMFCYFAEADLDLAIIEVGIGGLYDSTNFLTTTAVAVITSVALDHQKLLGNTVEAIAYQKAGIIRSDRPTVVGLDMNPVAKTVIEKCCQRESSPLIVAQSVPFKTALAGDYQRGNTNIAVAAYRAFRPNVTDEVLGTGLMHAKLPGRFEEVMPGVFLDGAHNPAGLEALQRSIDARFDQPVMLVIGALADKSLGNFLNQIVEKRRLDVRLFNYQGIPGRPGMTCTDYDEKVFGPPLASVDEVIQLAKEKGEPVFFTGSLYFVADVRRQICQKKKYSAQS